MSLDNALIAELLARRGAEVDNPHRARAYRRAARAAFLWPAEAADLVEAEIPLSELYGVGPKLALSIQGWIQDPPTDLEIPEFRRDFLTLTKARAAIDGADPEWADIKGDLQMHTEGSDGSDPVAEMARAADSRGYSFIAITDHTAGLKIAGGMDETQFAEQWLEIEGVNDALASRESNLVVLKGAEVNISVDGQPDMDPEFLQTLDIAVGSFHSSLRTKDDQTRRYVSALDSGSFDILGHPRGRMYGRRAGLNADWEAVFEAAIRNDVALEIDCYPDRQDLQGELLARVATTSAKISIGTDSHASDQFDFIELGIGAAIRAGIGRDRILNYWDLDELLDWARTRRTKAHSA
jgi:putative hydrolase